MLEPKQTISDVQIIGGHKLTGSIVTNGAQNSSVALIAASLINKGTTILHNVSKIEDVFRLIEIIKSIGVNVEWIGDNSLKIKPQEINLDNLDYEAAQRAGRSTILLFGPLIHYLDQFEWPHAGGCKMGERTIAAHRYGLEKLGVDVETKEDCYVVSHTSFNGADFSLYEASDTAAENLSVAASLIPGKTIIRFAPPNYQVQEVCFFLEDLGVQIQGIGSTTLEIQGVKDINKDIEYTIAEDPIESMMFIAAGIVTNSTITIERCPIDFLRLEMLKLDIMGLNYEMSDEYVSKNNRTKLVDITIQPSTLKALNDKIHALPYPGINSDNLPFFVPIATQAQGTTLIHDWMWENRAIYFTELNRLGAEIKLADPHRVFITGPSKLKGARIVCPPALRPSMIILIAMLAAEGESILHSVYSINRGYENIFERLNSLGAKIKTIHE